MILGMGHLLYDINISKGLMLSHVLEINGLYGAYGLFAKLLWVHFEYGKSEFLLSAFSALPYSAILSPCLL